MGAIEIVTGLENLSNVRIESHAAYMFHDACPVNCRFGKTVKGVALAGVCKMKHTGPRGASVKEIGNRPPFYLNARNNNHQLQAAVVAWMHRTYDIPNGVVVRLDISENYSVQGWLPRRGVIFLRARETGPMIRIGFRQGHGLDYVCQGRFDILTPEMIGRMGLPINMNEIKFMDTRSLSTFISLDIVMPALKEDIDVTETVQIDGESVQIQRTKQLRQVD